jgi:predicted kinase
MVIAEYVQRCTLNNDFSDDAVRGLYACVFHDVGKPSARLEKFSETRGQYFSYPGHEQVSARLFENYAVTNLRGDLSADDMYKVGLMVEHHLPWDTEKSEKRRRLALTAQHVGANVFVRVLLSDAYGRTSDDAAEKRDKSNKWCDDFLMLVANTVPLPVYDPRTPRPQLYIPIGPSGCGKSTFLGNLQHVDPVAVFSLDVLRHEFYDADDYSKAYQASVDDTTFMARANARFTAVIKLGEDLYVDNTNLSAKRRTHYLDQARKQGYYLVAVLMPVALDVVIARQSQRSDKHVPEAAVRQQYNTLQLPMLGEFDYVAVLNHNM